MKKNFRKLKRKLKNAKYLNKKRLVRYITVAIIDIIGMVYLYYSYINNDIKVPSVTLQSVATGVLLLAVVLIGFGAKFTNQLEDIQKDTAENIHVSDLSIDELLKNRDLLKQFKESFDTIVNVLFEDEKDV